MRTSFHLAYHVRDLDEARAFYGTLLGCQEGRSTETWVDFDFFGHKPGIRFEGEPGEQATMFFRDPSGNPIEVKGFADLDKVFAK
jgi:extradiol dioxygenase family protein